MDRTILLIVGSIMWLIVGGMIIAIFDRQPTNENWRSIAIRLFMLGPIIWIAFGIGCAWIAYDEKRGDHDWFS